MKKLLVQMPYGTAKRFGATLVVRTLSGNWRIGGKSLELDAAARKCQQGPNAGKPGPCPDASGGSSISIATSGSGSSQASSSKLPKDFVAPVKPGKGTPNASLKAQSKYVASLPKEQKSAVVKYTGEAYADLNKRMRSCPPDFGCLDKKQSQMFDQIEQAIWGAGYFDEPQTVYRGLQVDKSTQAAIIKQALATKKSGKPFQMPSITSTSIDSSVATGDFGDGIVFKMAARSGLYVQSISKYEEERELIMSPNAKFNVVDAKDGVVYLDEIVDEDLVIDDVEVIDDDE